MPGRFLHLLHPPELKLIGGSALAVLASAADSLNIPTGSWESTGVKTILIGAVIWLVRELSMQRAAHRSEAEKRERELAEVVKANTIAKHEMALAMDDLRSATREQTEYYKTVARAIINREMRHEDKS